ncbi:MAG: HaeII family restriction endonuclease [Blastocatellia bacterium]|nr:HaeII family restriction endonuclease [Blastocatellia bacterium]
MPTLEEAKTRLDLIIGKSRVDLYKPIHIAEVLHRSRTIGDFDITKLETFQNPSLRWRNDVTQRLAGKVSTSSARYQHDVWSETAMLIELLVILDSENKATNGAIESYIYSRYGERQGTVSSVISAIKDAMPESFKLENLLELFVKEAGIRRSIDKAYEIVVYSLFETIISALEAKVKVSISENSKPILQEFSDLAKVLLGVDENNLSWEQNAHIFRVGVTNAADRGLDMWANFGVAVQVKHLTLNEKLANSIANQVESNSLVIVCKDAEAKVIETVLKQIGYGLRVRGIVKESDLIRWYERCLRGRFSEKLAKPLLERLLNGFEAEFPFSTTLAEFLEERGYNNLEVSEIWKL